RPNYVRAATASLSKAATSFSLSGDMAQACWMRWQDKGAGNSSHSSVPVCSRRAAMMACLMAKYTELPRESVGSLVDFDALTASNPACSCLKQLAVSRGIKLTRRSMGIDFEQGGLYDQMLSVTRRPS